MYTKPRAHSSSAHHVHAAIIYHRKRHCEGIYAGSEKRGDTVENADSEGDTDTSDVATEIPERVLLPERRPPARRHR